MDRRRASGVAGVGHFLNRERRAAGRDVQHDRHLAAAVGRRPTPLMAVAFWPATVADLPKVYGPPISSSLATWEESSPPTSSPRPWFEVGNDSHLLAYFDDSALVRPITCCERGFVALHVSSRPDHRAVMCSVIALAALHDQRLRARGLAGVTGDVELGAVLLGDRGEVHALGRRRPSGPRCTWPLRRSPAAVVVVVPAAPAGAARRQRWPCEAASPVATAAVRAGLWRKGCMTFTLLEARHGGAMGRRLGQGWRTGRHLPTSPAGAAVVGALS